MDKMTKSAIFFKEILKMHVNPTDVIPETPELVLAYFFKLLDQHRVELLVYSILKERLSDCPIILKYLQERCQKLLLGHLRQQKVLFDLAKIFDANKISYVVLKGVSLNLRLYGDQAIRRSRDIDILIDVQDLMRVNGLLNKLGFWGNKSFGVLAEVFQALPQQYQEWLKDFTYQNKDASIYIELHIKPYSERSSFALEKTPEQSIVMIAQQKIYILTPEEDFLYLCRHAANHAWNRLQWLIDLGVFYQKLPFDWGLMCALAKEQQALRTVLEAKAFLEQEFGLSLPDVAATRMDKICLGIRTHFIKKIWLRSEERNSRLGVWKQRIRVLILSFFIFPSWKQKINYVRGLFFFPILEQIANQPNAPKIFFILKGMRSMCLKFFGFGLK